MSREPDPWRAVRKRFPLASDFVRLYRRFYHGAPLRLASEAERWARMAREGR